MGDGEYVRAGAPAWGLVVPVKLLGSAKTRLLLTADERADLALAFALDTVTAALACGRVRDLVVVTSDGRAARAMTALGALVVPDEPGAGLNAALLHGVSRLREAGLLPVAGLAADLPALRPYALAAALRRAEAHATAYVPDADDTGTTLLCAGAGAGFTPRFGPQSAARHAASGAHRLPDDGLESLRRDVDTEADLAVAVALGVGNHTLAALGAASAGGPSR